MVSISGSHALHDAVYDRLRAGSHVDRGARDRTDILLRAGQTTSRCSGSCRR
ncbi:MAG: hypothetical protein MZV63_54880 [Marinilabiliales bacterium]|nr:hypothetical protein [Marinilabiliales bacterium]